jgi:hypothetical protein
LRPWFVLRREPQQVGDGGGSHLIADQRNQVMASNQQFLIDGALPDQGAKDSFRSELARNRHIEPATMQALAAISPRIGGPLAGLRAAVSLIVDDTATLELSEGQRRTRVLRVIGPTPTVLAALYRLGRGETPTRRGPELESCRRLCPHGDRHNTFTSVSPRYRDLSVTHSRSWDQRIDLHHSRQHEYRCRGAQRTTSHGTKGWL